MAIKYKVFDDNQEITTFKSEYNFIAGDKIMIKGRKGETTIERVVGNIYDVGGQDVALIKLYCK